MDERKFGKQKRVEKNLSHLPERPKAPHDSGLLTLRHDHYTIAWICRLPIEMVAAQVMLDENHESLPTHADDSNTYILGSIKRHNVAIVYLPLGNDGNVADFIASMKRTFTAIRVELMVGIGGGVPSMADVHLGDIVVGTRVMQYDLGKIVENGKFERITVAKAPSSLLETVVNALRAKHKSSPSRISSILQQRLGKTSGYGRPKSPDRLFLATYDHLSPSAASCDECDHSKLVPRSERESDDIVIHYGPIASGNQVMRHGVARDNVGRELNVVCFEMETVGLMNNLPCLLIKGISDYSDSHRNQEWQRYAAATAAAYARELLEELPETSHGQWGRFLDSLRFEQTDAPGLTIEPIQAKACQWFLDHPDYKAWMDPKKLTHHHGFLWISGKPGAGKSTIMKFLYLHMKKNTRHNDSVIASFFFNCRGQYLERSTLGMYQSLLRQLLEGYPDLQTILDNHELVSQSQSSNRSLNVLKSLLYEAILALRQRSFICFVDGLDECDEQQVMDMVQYFEDLAEQSTAKDISFRICFSSRHYPYIPCRQGIRLTLEDQSGHLEDLAIYVTNRLQVEDQDLRYQLLSKSAGVFIWVILMVALLSKERRKGELSLRKRLAEVPSGLSELFKDILRHDCEREEELRLCILWLLCAARPLQPNEFYHALHSGLSPMGLVDDKIPDVTVPGAIDRSNRLVISSSKGLAEISNSTRPIVQFIHESVRNFLIKEKGLYELWPDIGSDWISPSHEMLKQCCNFYINDTSVRASVSKLQFEFKPDARTEIVKVYPFLEYASQYILYHANTAAKVIPQDEFLSSFPVSNWITINNLFEFDTVDEYSLDASLFYILADNGFSELIRTRLKADPESHIIGGRYRYPLFAALAKGNMDTVAALLNLPTNIYKGVDIIEDLNSGEDLKNYTNRTPLSWAAQGGRTEIFELLLQTQTTVNDVDWEGRTPLSRASENGHEAVVRLAIDKGADVNANDKNGLTPLLWASQNGHDKVVRLLIDGGADVHNAKIMETAVAATATSELNRRAVLRLFLDRIGDEVIITEAVAIAAVSNSSNGRALLELLLDRKGDEVIITEAVAIAAVSNRYNGRALLELLLDRKGDEIIITEAIAIAAVSNSLNGQALLELLLDRRGDEIIITEAVAIAAVSNSLNGRGLLELLLDRKGDEIIITEAIAIAAVSNSSDGQALLELLLDRRGDEVNITDKILRVAAENFANRDGIIKLLLDRKGNDIKITDGIVQVGAVNEAIGNIGPKKDEKSTQIFSSVGKGLDPFTEGTPFFRGSLAPNSSNYVSDQIFSAEQRSTLNTQRASLSDVEDLQTAYSDTLTMNHSVKEIYIDKLVRELLKHFSPFQMDRSSMRRITDAMPDCLKAFSLRLGSNELSQHVHREVPAFIRKYRQDIADAFMSELLDDSSTTRESRAGDNMALDEKMKLWSDHDADSVDDEECSKPIQESDIFPDAEGECSPIPADIVDLHPEIKIGETFKVVMPELHEYREYIVRHPAYDWLLSDLQRHCLHNSSTQEVRAEINRTILHGLPSQTRFSRRDSELPYKMTYTVDWDLISFLEDQDYNEESFKALPLVITITGSRKAAQALTCSQYLHQIWPSSAGEVLKLLQTLLESGPRNKARVNLSDGTRLAAWFYSSQHSKECRIIFEVIGSAYSIAEVGEQLSWLGSALRSSPYPDPIAYCRPQVEKFQMTDYKSQTAKRQFTAEVSADISFAMDRIEFSSNASGECWHDLFRNCVVVQGYPISRRLECGASSGLEIPLHMMACLAKANFVNTFRNCLILKGFSAMLVPTENYDEVIVWHLVYNKNGDRISYLDSTVDPAEGLIAGRLSQARHILGWCSDTRYLAGTRDAKYEVSGSRLPRPRDNGIFSQAFISSGKLRGGEPFLDGYKDVPFHISRGGYLKKLKWIIQKSAVLWDEETKQGWLLNGAGALLHLVRASIMHDSTGPLSSECLFRWENLEEAPAHITRTPESAIAVLSDRGNRALTIYQDKDEHINFEDRVEHFLNIFEQIFDYQVHAVGPDGSGYSSKSIPRAHFEGWDFHDLSTESDPLFPRLAKIPVKGKSWIDFTRSIHTINLFGRGFGEMLEPSTVSCPYWASLPRDQYYLAAGIAELQQMVVKYTGDLTANPVRLSENLVWHNPKMVFEFCDCADATADHADLVQVILPATLSDEPQQCNNTVTLARNGAVVFGYNRRFRWRWGDIGDPERDDIKDNNEVPVASTYISGHDDIKTQVGSESDYFRLSNTQASSIKDTVATSSADHGSARPNHLLRSYTKWNLESLRAEDYAVGILCALPLELLAVRALFDQTHPDLSLSAVDSNHYALGRIGRHKVVTACLPYGEYGTNSAADVASNLRRSFPSVKFCLLVGIGGGVPSPRHDIRLGDVVVSKPIGISPGVIQYDMGKALENGVFEQSGFLQAPSRVIMTALSILESDPHLPPNPLQEYIEEITACRKEYRYPGPENDRLFSSVYAHNPKHATCDSCSISHVTTRPSRSNHHPQIHYGLIASGNRVMKDAKLRDIWCMERDVLCFEMEAAGIVNTFPCLVIRGICDYSDSHKNKQFQEYAAATAASYAKLLLYHLKDSIHLNGTA